MVWIVVIVVVAVIAVVGWRRTRWPGSVTPRETGEQRRWKDDGKASFIGHGF